MCLSYIAISSTPSDLVLGQGILNLEQSQELSHAGKKDPKQVLRPNFVSFDSTASGSTQTSYDSSEEFDLYGENESSSVPSKTTNAMYKITGKGTRNNDDLVKKAMAFFASSSSSSYKRNAQGFQNHAHDEDDSMTFAVGQRSKALRPDEWEENM